MNKTSLIIAIIFCAKISLAQSTEKFMKLQRIVILDSSKIFSNSGVNQNNTDRVFSIITPNNVIWKINKLVFCAIPGQNDYINSIKPTSGINAFLKINNSWMSPALDEFIPFNIGSAGTVDPQVNIWYGLNIFRPLWVRGQSIIELRSTQPINTQSQPAAPSFSLYLVA